MTTLMTDDSVVITQKILDILTDAKGNLGVAATYYGDEIELIPKFPAIAVESWPKERKLSGTHQFQTTFRVGIMIHHGKIQPAEINKKETEELARAIELELMKHKRLDGLVAFGYVTRVEPGVSVKRSVMLQTTRLTWEGLSKVTFDD